MARSINKVILIGRLGADPEIKYSPAGTAIANFNLATSENRKNPDGDWEEKTEWHRVVMFGKQAETCKDYLHKGNRIYLEGRLQTRSWDDQGGKKNYMTEVVGNTMMMLDQKGQEGAVDAPGPKGKASSGGRATPEPPASDFPEGDDDLPF